MRNPLEIQEEESGFDDRRMEVMMGRLLQVGVGLASVVVLAGAAIYLISRHGQLADYRVFVSEPEALRDPGQLRTQIVHGDGAALIQLGVLLLIATPVARVIFAVVAFLVERDWLYVAISLFVLVVLTFGLIRAS
jgi:Predicted membrane protein